MPRQGAGTQDVKSSSTGGCCREPQRACPAMSEGQPGESNIRDLDHSWRRRVMPRPLFLDVFHGRACRSLPPEPDTVAPIARESHPRHQRAPTLNRRCLPFRVNPSHLPARKTRGDLTLNDLRRSVFRANPRSGQETGGHAPVIVGIGEINAPKNGLREKTFPLSIMVFGVAPPTTLICAGDILMRRTIWLGLLLAVSFNAPLLGQQWAVDMFETTSHEFGSVARSAKAEFEFRLTNVYLEDLHISSVRSSCGCTQPRIKKQDLKTYDLKPARSSPRSTPPRSRETEARPSP